MDPQTRIIEHGGCKLEVRLVPPPHLMFLASKIQAAGDTDPLRSLAGLVGLLSIILLSVNGEPVEISRIPRNIEALREAGEQLLMELYDRGIPAALAVELTQRSIAVYGEGTNPT